MHITRAAAVATVVLLACQFASCLHKPKSSPKRHSPSRMGHKHFVKPSGKQLRSDQKPSRRIRGGTLSTSLLRPYMAAILIEGRVWCAGAVVHASWVLTAAHCLNYVLQAIPHSPLNSVSVRVGSKRALSGGKLLNVTEVVRHPNFEVEPPPHADVALLKLDAKLKLGKNIRLLKIYNGTEEPYAQSFVTVGAWGATTGSSKSFTRPPKGLRTARMKVRTQEYCAEAYQLIEGLRIKDDFFCASLRNGIRDTCLFDAGAPAVQSESLVGVMSFGPENCGDNHPPAVFIKAYSFRDFVISTLAASDIVEYWTEGAQVEKVDQRHKLYKIKKIITDDEPDAEKKIDAKKDDGDTADKPADDGDTADKPADDGDMADNPADDGDKAQNPADDGDKADNPADDGDKADNPADDGDKADNPADDGDKADNPADDGEKADNPADDGDKADNPADDGDKADNPADDGDKADNPADDGDKADNPADDGDKADNPADEGEMADNPADDGDIADNQP